MTEETNIILEGEIPPEKCNICKSKLLKQRVRIVKSIIIGRLPDRCFEIVCRNCGNLVYAKITKQERELI